MKKGYLLSLGLRQFCYIILELRKKGRFLSGKTKFLRKLVNRVIISKK